MLKHIINVIYLLVLLLTCAYAPKNYENISDDLLGDDFDDDFEDSHHSLGDANTRFARAVVSAVKNKNSKVQIQLVITKRRRFIIQCCGKKKCGARKPTEEPITTTTCTPICPTSNGRDAVLFTSFGNLNNSYTYGSWSVGCSKSYVFSKNTATFENAFIACSDIGMNLVSVDSVADQQCIHDANNGVKAPVSGTWWSSATSEGCTTNGLVFKWCGSNKVLVSKLWTSGQPDNAGGTEKCGSILVNQGPPPAQAMSDQACDSLLNYICEGPTTTCKPECPIYVSTTEPTLFKPNKALANAYAIGDWRIPPANPLCDTNTLYLFSYDTKTYLDAMKFCTSIGMTLLSIETAAEHTCLTDLNNAHMKFAATTFWTSALNQNCPTIYNWCSTGVDMYIGIAWAANQPDLAGYSEWCAQITMNTGADSLSVLNDLPCETVNKYICEGPTTTCIPECPVIDCTTQPTLFNTNTKALIEPYAIGDWRTPTLPACSNMTLYLFINATKTFDDAMKYCCSIGMRLLSIKSAAEHTCLTNLNNADMKFSAAKYWTSGSNLNCRSSYKWCAANLDVYPGIAWTANQPSLSGNTAWCAELDLNTGADTNSVLNEVPCSNLDKFICEGPTTTCVPECPVVDCTTQPTLFFSNKVLMDPTAVGVWKVPKGATCPANIQYVFSPGTKSFIAAMQYCCSIGMKLLSIETAAEHQCLTDLNNADMKFSAAKYWTSGSNLNCRSSYKWCAANLNVYPGIAWTANQPSLSGNTAWCAELDLNTGADTNSVLNEVPCSNLNKFICEGPTTTCVPECPVVECTTQPTLYTAKYKNLINPAGFGVWKIPKGATCPANTEYMFSTGSKTYLEAMQFCCSIGLKLLSIETPDEHTCLTDLNNADMNYAGVNFWTSGSNTYCKPYYKWCSTNVDMYKGITWGTNQPDFAGNNEWCAQFVMNKGADSLSVLNDVSCATASRFICEGTTTCMPECPDVECTTAISRFDPGTNVITNKASYGTWKIPTYPTCTGKTEYLFTTGSATYLAALTTCCEIGMKFLSIETPEEHTCLTDLNNAEMKYSGGTSFWTSAANFQCKPSYVWCGNYTVLYKGIPWTPNNPDNFNDIEWVAQIKWYTGADSATLLNDMSDKILLPYICERQLP